jgi:hypothetical protein
VTCVDISKAGTEPPRYAIEVVGGGFDAWDGKRLRVVTTDGEPAHGVAQTTIRSGAFTVTIPEVIGHYTGVGAYIDSNEDDACAAGEDPLWQMTTGVAAGDVTWELTPEFAGGASTGELACSINGIFDLTQTLSCGD